MNIKNLKKRIMSFALIACMAGSITFMGTSDVNAAGTNPLNAETVSYAKDYYGTFQMNTNKKYHYYKFKTAKQTGMRYIVRGTYIDNNTDATNDGVEITLLDSNFNEVMNSSQSRSAWLNQPGATDNNIYNYLKANSTYYVCVHSYNNYEVYKTYAICVNKNVVKPGKPVVKLAKAGRGKVTFSYYKSKYAKRYQVQIKRVGGTWKTYNNGARLSKTFKSLKKGKKYTVRVRAQRYVNGKWYSGYWSKARTVKVR